MPSIVYERDYLEEFEDQRQVDLWEEERDAELEAEYTAQCRWGTSD